MDEGVQSVKRSVVPVRSISNLIGLGNQSNTSFDSSFSKPSVQGLSDKNYYIMNSPAAD
jgi:hypothetical protein